MTVSVFCHCGWVKALHYSDPNSHLDGKKSLKEVIKVLSEEFDDPESKIEPDVLGLVGELARKKIVKMAGDA